MFEVFEDCATGKYRRKVVTTTKSKVKRQRSTSQSFDGLEFDNGVPVIRGNVVETLDDTISLTNVRLFMSQFF